MNNENKYDSKEDNIKTVYKSAMDHMKTDEEIEENTIKSLESAGQTEFEHSGLNFRVGKRRKRLLVQQKRFYFAAAACIVALFLIPLAFHQTRPKIELSPASKGVKVTYVNKAPGFNVSYDLVQLTEEQILKEYSDAAFRGTIKEVQNIEISFGLSTKEYRAIATISVDKTYRGDMKSGDLIQILLPCPIDKNIWVEDTEVASAIRVGMEGIFLPKKYDDTSIWSEDGGTLYLKDICAYGFGDGARFAFLKTDQGILYAEWAFGINPVPATLDDVEKYILTKLE